MKFRDILKVFAGLPRLRAIAIARIEPNDVIVVQCEDPIDDELGERIRQWLSPVWPDRKIVVHGPEVELKVVRNG
jgi:hypothetical protein